MKIHSNESYKSGNNNNSNRDDNDYGLSMVTEEEEGKSILIWMEVIVRIIRTVFQKHTSAELRKLNFSRSKKTKDDDVAVNNNSSDLYKEILVEVNKWIQSNINSSSSSDNSNNSDSNGDANNGVKNRNKLIHSSLWNKIQKCRIYQNTFPLSSSHENIDTVDEIEDLERNRRELVLTLLVPIVSLFANHYLRLDATEDDKDILKNDDHNEETAGKEKDRQQQKINSHRHRRKNNTPKAPKGLLSIVNYIDVACLLEILVSFSILTNLQFTTPKRTLPKSFSTRIPLAALSYAVLQQQQQQQQRKIKNDESSSEIMAAVELSTTLSTLGSLFSLDRFQHILLPRHVTDVYAAIFQLERYYHNKAVAVAMSSPTQLKWTRLQDWSSNHNNGININIHLRIKSYQTLLSSGSVPVSAVTPKNTNANAKQLLTPQWLKHRIGQQFLTIATTNILPLLMAFVLQPTHNISNNDGNNSADFTQISTAAKRFGAVLTTTPTHISSPQTNKLFNTSSYTFTNKEDYYRLLFQQFIPLLSYGYSQNNDIINDGEKKIQLAAVTTTWCILENLNNPSNHMIISELFFPMFTRHFLPDTIDTTIEKQTNPTATNANQNAIFISMRRLRSLLSNTIPTTSSKNIVKKICNLLLFHPLLQSSSSTTTIDQSSHSIIVTVLDQLIRIATASSSNIQYSRGKEEATLTIQLLLYNSLTNNSNDNNYSLMEHVQSTSTALLKSFLPHILDIRGFQYHIDDSNTNENPNKDLAIEKISLIQFPQNSSSSSFTNADEVNIFDIESSNSLTIEEENIIGIERRIQYIIDHILLPFASESISNNHDTSQSQTNANIKSVTNNDNDCMKDHLKWLPSSLFQLLLTIYFQSSNKYNSNTLLEKNNKKLSRSHLLPDMIVSHLNDYRIISMVAIPILCEKCTMSSLLLEEQESCFSKTRNSKNQTSGSGSGVLKMISTTIEAAASTYNFIGSEKDVNDDDPTFLFQTHLQDETQLSILSIMLSMLVTMLELGSKKRHVTDEELIASILPALQNLASNNTNSFQIFKYNVDANKSIDQNNMNELAAVKAEIAEMASHAMALISSRNIVSETQNEEYESKNKKASHSLSIWDRIHQAQSDLLSNQPPIRARGIVSLRHIAKGYLSDNLTNDNGLGKQLIAEIVDNIEESRHVRTTPNESENILELCLRLAIVSLSDDESYVFLAGVQTIVAIADVNPSYIIPLIVSALSMGELQSCQLGSSAESNHKEIVSKIELSATMKVKLADALIFIIRRRGNAIFIHYQIIMDMILFGNKNKCSIKERNRISNDDLIFIQTETDQYFRNGRNVGRDDNDTISNEEKIEERELRCRTGGPVFNNEENDLVQAACILIASEVVSSVSTSPGALFLPYCSALVKLASYAIQLDGSRPVRRAAALLCRELYSCVLQESFHSGSNHNPSSKIGGDVGCFAVEFVASGEKNLFAALKLCIIEKNSKKKGSANELYDPATEARCQEALEARTLANEYGIFTAAEIVLKDQQKLGNNSFIRFLEREMPSNFSSLPINNKMFIP